MYFWKWTRTESGKARYLAFITSKRFHPGAFRWQYAHKWAVSKPHQSENIYQCSAKGFSRILSRPPFSWSVSLFMSFISAADWCFCSFLHTDPSDPAKWQRKVRCRASWTGCSAERLPWPSGTGILGRGDRRYDAGSNWNTLPWLVEEVYLWLHVSERSQQSRGLSFDPALMYYVEHVSRRVPLEFQKNVCYE